MNLSHLIIFVKNAELGKVKTRLAKDIGDENALAIYLALIDHTEQVTRPVLAQKKCYYSDFIANSDVFSDEHYEKSIQKGEDLGERMYNAAKVSSGEWANKIIIIGSDCYDINSGVIEEAFKALDSHDFVIGPAEDGGYYLIGMTEPHSEIFLNKVWSTENVFLDTLLDIKKLKKTHYLLPTLSDVDTIADLPENLKRLLD
jgi:rSAM/selenodomain-associated transferase 1